nr:MAG: hypothetical protein [Bacteriophage sp.]
MDKIYKIPITPYESVDVYFDQSYIVWLDKAGNTHIINISNAIIYEIIEIITELFNRKDFQAIKYVIGHAYKNITNNILNIISNEYGK